MQLLSKGVYKLVGRSQSTNTCPWPSSVASIVFLSVLYLQNKSAYHVNDSFIAVASN